MSVTERQQLAEPSEVIEAPASCEGALVAHDVPATWMLLLGCGCTPRLCDACTLVAEEFDRINARDGDGWACADHQPELPLLSILTEVHL